MTQEGQKITKSAYEDPEIVSGYIKAHAEEPKLFGVIDEFAKTVDGKRVVDIGCGPGHDSYHFAELGFNVVGIDYSEQMIKAANELKKTRNHPRFQQADMKDLGEMFDNDSFDAAWVSASLLHIPESEVPQVLQGIKKIVKAGGKVYIGLKAGKQGERIVEEGKYGKPMQRQFTFWEKEKFASLAERNGLRLIDVAESGNEATGQPVWLNFFFAVEK